MLWKYCSYLAMAVSFILAMLGVYVMVATTTVYLPFVLAGLAFGLTYVAEGCIRKHNEQLITLNRWEFEEMQTEAGQIGWIEGPEPGDADYEGPEHEEEP